MGSADHRHIGSASSRLRRGRARVPVQSKRRLDCASCLHRAGVALRFLYAPNRVAHSAAERLRKTWRRCLAAVILAPIALMVLCGITHCRFTTPLRSGAAAVEMRTLNDRAQCPWNRSMRAAIFLATLFGAGVSSNRGYVDYHEPRSSPDVCLR